MQHQEQQVILVIKSRDSRSLNTKQLSMIQQALAQRFKDAEFEVRPAPSYFRSWHSSQLPEKLRQIYQILANASGWVRLDQYSQARVYIHRLNHKLPDYLKVIVKRNYGYRLIDLRHEE